MLIRIVLGKRNLEIQVVDDGHRAPEPGLQPGREPGPGLLGIRERVALFEGRVLAGPRSDAAGWRVDAVLPVPAPEPATA